MAQQESTKGEPPGSWADTTEEDATNTRPEGLGVAAASSKQNRPLNYFGRSASTHRSLFWFSAVTP
ncbi:hypothetical protein AK812_SmicGene48807, partial [Symbiodinium microadriaticum]